MVGTENLKERIAPIHVVNFSKVEVTLYLKP